MTFVRLLLIAASALTAGWCLDRNRVLANDWSNSTADRFAVTVLGIQSAAPAQSKTAEQPNYPVIIADSADRRAGAERDWRRMLDAYSAADVPPDLYAITYTPKSLPAAVAGMKITSAQIAELEDGTGLREAVKIFLDRWRDLLNVDPDATSLASASKTGDTIMLSYRQANYPYPVVGGFGTLSLWVTQDGRLKQIDDQFIPAVDLPSRPALERTATAERVIGRTFNFSDRLGKNRTVSITDAKQIAVGQIVVLPLKKEARIEVHLAWQVDVTAAPGCTVYVDAMTGESLLAAQSGDKSSEEHQESGTRRSDH